MERLGADQPHLILDEDFADPFIARFGTTFHGYATGIRIGGAQVNVQHRSSANLTQWSAATDVLPDANLPAWVDRSHAQVWAPEVMEIGGRYVLYFNARHATLTRTETPPEGPQVLKRICLGAAVSERPEGPFVGTGEPLVCAEFASGVIDASPFRDGDDLYLYYKEDANCCSQRSAIYGQRLSPDGLSVTGPRRRLLANNDSPEEHDDWEWWVVEAPTMVRRGATYYLFYSGNFFGNHNYAVGYARCASALGPCDDPGDNPILYSHRRTPLIGPGHQTILDLAGSQYVFFHGWNERPGRARERPLKRCLYVSRLGWEPRPGSNGERPRIVGGEPPTRR